MALKNWIRLHCLCVTLQAFSAHAQYFRTNAVVIPAFGWNFVDSTIPWNPQSESDFDRIIISDQMVVSVGYMGAIIDTSLWWSVATSFSFGSISVPNDDFKGATAAIGGSTGLRYNFLEARIRPFVTANLDLVHTFGRDGLSFPFQIGPRAELGAEWIFGDEVSVQLSAGYSPLFNFALDNLVRHHLVTRLSFNLYL